MSQLTQPTSSVRPTSNGGTAILVTEYARRALERLLDLGVKVVDVHLEALQEIPAALVDVADALQGVHGAFEALPATRGVVRVPILAAHAARRKQLDLHELKTLIQLVATASSPEIVGRRVVITALVLLSNLESDERWYGSLKARRRAA